MPPNQSLRVRVGERLLATLVAEGEQRGQSLSQLIRERLARSYGDPSLAEHRILLTDTPPPPEGWQQ